MKKTILLFAVLLTACIVFSCALAENEWTCWKCKYAGNTMDFCPRCGNASAAKWMERAGQAEAAGDIAEQTACMKEAAAGGNGEALYRLGVCYTNGDGVEKDYDQAFGYFQGAIEAGYEEGRMLGWMGYLCMIQQRYVEARVFCYQGAELGDQYSTATMGDIYFKGQGVDKDLDKAWMWYEKHAENYAYSAYGLARIRYAQGDGEAALALFEQSLALDQGDFDDRDATCYYFMGELYRNGKGSLEADEAKGFEYHLMAAQMGQTYSYAILGDCWFESVGTEVDLDQAAMYYQMSIDSGLQVERCTQRLAEIAAIRAAEAENGEEAGEQAAE